MTSSITYSVTLEISVGETSVIQFFKGRLNFSRRHAIGIEAKDFIAHRRKPPLMLFD